jgi:hypothetical protein
MAGLGLHRFQPVLGHRLLYRRKSDGARIWVHPEEAACDCFRFTAWENCAAGGSRLGALRKSAVAAGCGGAVVSGLVGAGLPTNSLTPDPRVTTLFFGIS